MSRVVSQLNRGPCQLRSGIDSTISLSSVRSLYRLHWALQRTHMQHRQIHENNQSQRLRQLLDHCADGQGSTCIMSDPKNKILLSDW